MTNMKMKRVKTQNHPRLGMVLYNLTLNFKEL
ncbi:hypothetical protein SAMN05443667_102135 [Flavobacterium gillisiae]|uniref:Uncharacterized protein n=1 Tax=Flavobacterium gillisiae TaxID=150146 RepID=A0A1H3YVP2_9FLAO|nr:hypothetical protein SAMN05443667_102135 [Flavobacterium gillisiae]